MSGEVDKEIARQKQAAIDNARQTARNIKARERLSESLALDIEKHLCASDASKNIRVTLKDSSDRSDHFDVIAFDTDPAPRMKRVDYRTTKLVKEQRTTIYNLRWWDYDLHTHLKIRGHFYHDPQTSEMDATEDERRQMVSFMMRRVAEYLIEKERYIATDLAAINRKEHEQRVEFTIKICLFVGIPVILILFFSLR